MKNVATAPAIKVSVIEAGTLTIPCDFAQVGETSYSGNLADYELASADSLYAQASKMQFVERNGKTIKGSNYTLKMAQNDYKKYAK